MELGCCNYGKVVGLLEPVLDLKLEFVHTRLTAMCHICFNIWEMQGWHHARFWKSQSSISLHSFPRHGIDRKKDHQRCFSFLKKKEQKHGWVAMLKRQKKIGCVEQCWTQEVDSLPRGISLVIRYSQIRSDYNPFNYILSKIISDRIWNLTFRNMDFGNLISIQSK